MILSKSLIRIVFSFIVIFLSFTITNGQRSQSILGDSIVKNAMKKNQPLPWLTISDMEAIDPGYDKNAIRAEHKELMATNNKELASFRSWVTNDASVELVHENPVGLLYEVKNSRTCIILFMRIVENKQGMGKLLLIDVDTIQNGLSYLELGKKFENKNKDISILYYQKALKKNLDVQQRRSIYYFMAIDAGERGYFEDEIKLYKSLAKTDIDTFLIAAEAYGRIASIYHYHFKDSVESIAAEKMQLNYLDMSINLFPENISSYVAKLQFYKYASIKKGKEEYIQTLKDKFKDRWEITFALADSYIEMDFLNQHDKGYATAKSYLLRTIELNPNHFNSYLLLCSEFSITEKERINYLKKMYSLEPKQFVRGTKNDYVVTSIRTAQFKKDLNLSVSGKEFLQLK